MTGQSIGLLMFRVQRQDRLDLIHRRPGAALDYVLGGQQETCIDRLRIHGDCPFEVTLGHLRLVGEKERTSQGWSAGHLHHLRA